MQNGKVTAVAAGIAQITATADGKSDVCTVTVNAPQSQNPYAELTEAIEKVRGSTVLAIYTVVAANGNARLRFYDYKDGELCSVITSVKLDTDNLIESAKGVSAKELEGAQIVSSVLCISSNSTTSITNSENVQAVIDRYAGDEYKVIYGSYLDARKGVFDTEFNTEYYSSTINALLVKDGELYVYKCDVATNNSDIITATKFRKSEIFTSLGEVAKDYYANKGRYINPYDFIVKSFENIRNSHIVSIYSNQDNNLCFYDKIDNMLYSVVTDIKVDTDNPLDSVKSIDQTQITNSVLSAEAVTSYPIISNSDDVVKLFFSAEHKAMLHGIATELQKGEYDERLGAVAYLCYINAVVVKEDGLYMISHTIAFKGNQLSVNAYLKEESVTSLGELANDYYRECVLTQIKNA